MPKPPTSREKPPIIIPAKSITPNNKSIPFEIMVTSFRAKLFSSLGGSRRTDRITRIKSCCS